MNYEIAHMRVIHRRLGGTLPCCMGGLVVGKYAYNIQLRQIRKSDFIDIFEFAPKDKM